MRLSAPVSGIRTGGERVYSTLVRWSSLAAVLGGLLFLLGLFLPYVRPAEAGGAVTNVPLYALYVTLFTAGEALFAIALWGMSALHIVEGKRLPRPGRAGVWTATVGIIMLVLASAHIVASAVSTGKPPDAWVLFALGWLLLIVGLILTGIGTYRAHLLGKAGMLPIITAASALVAILVPVDPFHDVGFLAVGLSWIVLGFMLRTLHHHGGVTVVSADIAVPR